MDRYMELPRTLAIEDVAARIGVSSWTVRTWIRQGMLSYHKIGRRVLLVEDEVRELFAKNHRPARRPESNGAPAAPKRPAPPRGRAKAR
jgi:excisionase family DNA binding protein